MSKGYSIQFVNAVNEADSDLLGVKLGLVCVKNDIPVNDVAEYLSVTRMTVYNWFKGTTTIQDPYIKQVEKLVTKLKN